MKRELRMDGKSERPMNCRLEKRNGVEVLFFHGLDELSFIRHAVFLDLDHSRFSGSARQRRTATGPENLPYGIELFRDAGIPAEEFVTLQQVHGTVCVPVDKNGATVINGSEGDCLITSDRSIAIGVKTADCLPLLLADPKEKIVACVHAGWRGIALGILESCLKKMSHHFSCEEEDLLVAIGPGIGKCCFEVKEDAIDLFRSRHAEIEKFISRRSNGAVMLSLEEIAIEKLLLAGIRRERISTCGLCTSCSDANLPSFRRDGWISRTILSAIMIV